MFHLKFQKEEKILSDKTIIRFLVIVVIVLTYIAGYYHAALDSERKKYFRLEDLYVRVRSELGRDETQRLIDISREKELDYYQN